MGLKSIFNPLGVNFLPYTINTILYEANGANAPVVELNLPKGIYEITACGAGGNAYAGVYGSAYIAGGGGAGGFAKCDVKIPAGKYLFFPGANGIRNAGCLAESGEEMFIAYNGGDGAFGSGGAGGGVLYPSKFAIVTTYNWTGGNSGQYNAIQLPLTCAAAGGASVDPYLGYGRGATANGEGAATGYIKLIYKGTY